LLVTSVVLIGASAGGIEPLIRVIEGLPAHLAAPVLIVVHIPPDAESRLPEILQRRSAMPVAHAVNGVPLEPGRVFVAPPDRHLMLSDGVGRVVRGPRQNRHRPAIDTLLRTGAHVAGPDAVAVILSGAAGDGVAGSIMIANRGGQVFVQDPAEALFPGMPAKVLDAVPGATTLPVDEIAAAVEDVVGRGAEIRTMRPAARPTDQEDEIMDEISGPAPIESGRPAYSCPDCGGVLEEIVDEGPLRFRCRVGHEFYSDDLGSAQWATLEDALWAAVRGMEENAELSSRLARIADENSSPRSAERHRDRAAEVQAQSRVIREFLLRPGATSAAIEQDEESGHPEGIRAR
jgi:two-component system, chemotaxis family, protein-glutamate methylesterase/glutaminase